MWGVVDLYGMTVKVTIVDRDERDEQNLITRWPKVQILKIKNCITQFLENERNCAGELLHSALSQIHRSQTNQGILLATHTKTMQTI